jgi:nucleotide-binding universal stress UspA family protein
MHRKVHTIVAATDLSRPAFAAVRRAALITRAHGAELEVVHVIPDSWRSTAWKELRGAFAEVETDLRNSVTENLDALVVQVETETGVRARAVIVDGKPFAEIAARAEAIDADVIVVGAHGENILTTPLLGTTAHRVLRCARRPVLLVKQTPPVEHAATPGYEHIVIATDFSEDSAQAAWSARRLFPQSSISLLNVYEASFEAKLSGRIPETALEQFRQRALERAHRELDSFAHRVNLSHAARVARHGLPSVRIREYVADTSADLIAIGSEEVPRLQNALLGSVSLDVVTQATCDVLLARTTADASAITA